MKKIVLISALMLSLVGCGGGGKDSDFKFDITSPIDSTVDFVVEGIFTGADNIELEFSDNKAIITSFGDSVFKSNPSILPIGSAYIDSISCDRVCSGSIAIPITSNGGVTDIYRETVTLSKNGEDKIKVSGSSLGDLEFIRKNQEPIQSTLTLDHTASCDEWWKALTSVETWRATSVKAYFLWGYFGFTSDDPGDMTFKFSGDSSYEFRWTKPYEGATPEVIKGDDLIKSENFTSMGHCRFIVGYPVLFPHSLSNGELVLIEEGGDRTPENGYRGVAIEILRLKAE